MFQLRFLRQVQDSSHPSLPESHSANNNVKKASSSIDVTDCQIASDDKIESPIQEMVIEKSAKVVSPVVNTVSTSPKSPDCSEKLPVKTENVTDDKHIVLSQEKQNACSEKENKTPEVLTDSKVS